MSKHTKYRFSIYKLRDSIASISEVTSKGYEEISCKDEKYKLYIQTKETKPKWGKILNQLVTDTSILSVRNSVASFVLISNIGEHTYALTGGHGYHAISNWIEEDFGIDLVSKLISPDRIKFLRRKPLTGRVAQEESVYKEYYNYNFDPTNWLKLPKEILGEMTNQGIQDELGIEFETKFKIKLQGKASFTINRSLSLDELEMVLSRLDSVDKKQMKFNLYKGFSEVKRKQTKADLNRLLVLNMDRSYKEFLNDNESFLESDIIISYADAKEYLYCDVYVISYKSSEPLVSEYLDLPLIYEYLQLNKVADIDESILSDVRIKGIDVEGMEIINNRLKAFLFAEVKERSNIYCLIDQKWFHIKDDFIKRVDEKVEEVISDSVLTCPSLPKWGVNGAKVISEDDYIDSVCTNKLVKMHRDHVYRDRFDKAEVCDIADFRSSDLNFIFIKSGIGSTMRELFAQARNSVELYILDSAFKIKSLDKLASKYTEHFDGSLKQVTLACTDKSVKVTKPLIKRLSTIIKLDWVCQVFCVNSFKRFNACRG